VRTRPAGPVSSKESPETADTQVTGPYIETTVRAAGQLALPAAGEAEQPGADTAPIIEEVAAVVKEERIEPEKVVQHPERPQEADTNLPRPPVEQAAIERGDRQLPDEPNRGYRIERLEGNHSTQAVPVESVFPNTEEYRAKEFARQYMDGTTPIKIVEDAWTDVALGKPGFVVYFPVAASKYEQAVAEGEVPAGLFDESGKVMHTQPGAEALEGLVDPETKRESVEAYYAKQPSAVKRQYIDDLDGITDQRRRETHVEN
jgi:hypothetical protein